MFKRFFGGILHSKSLNVSVIKHYWKYFKEKSADAKKFVAGVARDFLVVFGFLHVLQYYFFSYTRCIGPSMYPTINPYGEFVIIDVMSFKLRRRPYEVGDVIITVSPKDPNKTLCKRIAGVEGDKILFQRKYSMFTETIEIPQGHVWLLGDNPTNSSDSRDYGPVPVGLIIGRAIWQWDVSRMRFGTLKRPST